LLPDWDVPADRSVLPTQIEEEHRPMVILGIDAHKRTHTVVAIDGNGRQLATRTIGTATADHLALLRWADRFGTDRRWAVEDCRHLSRRLERALLSAGEQVTRVPAKLMAHVRDSARTYGKSDPIDALALARAALREPNLPTARLDGPDRDVRLLTDHRDGLVGERTRVINRLRWHLHELDPEWDPTPRSLDRHSAYDKLEQRLAVAGDNQLVVRLALKLVEQLRRLTAEIDELGRELNGRVEAMAPALLAITGCAHLTAAKIIGETAGICRFASKDAYARHNGTAPLPVWSSNRARHRLSRTGNRQLNAALHRIAMTQARCHPDARAMLARRRSAGDGGMEALRILKRRISDVVYRALQADAQISPAQLAA
jgi:transposase